MKKLIFGKGKVSNIIKKENDIELSRNECDITDYQKVYAMISSCGADIVLNCAAKTNLEYCEENKNEAFESNVLGVLNLIKVCKLLNKKLVHVSSGCLFDGNDFISYEESEPSPAVWYTWTKKWADELILNFNYDNVLILRPRQLISKTPHPTNMLTKFAGMNSIPAINEANSITCLEDFSEMIDHLINIDAKGIYNCANTGTVTPHEIALKVKEKINKELDVSLTTYESLLEALPNRRVNTILSTEKLEKSGYTPRSSTDALEWCVENYGL